MGRNPNDVQHACILAPPSPQGYNEPGGKFMLTVEVLYITIGSSGSLAVRTLGTVAVSSAALNITTLYLVLEPTY